MIHVSYEISKEDYEKAKTKNAYTIISEAITMGYGCYGVTVFEKDGHYYIEYNRRDGCN